MKFQQGVEMSGAFALHIFDSRTVELKENSVFYSGKTKPVFVFVLEPLRSRLRNNTTTAIGKEGLG
jgi:hypothetical protein